MANGSTGMQNPAATPARNLAACLNLGRQSTQITATGMMAHTLMAPANPNAAPPQISRRPLAS